MLKYSLNRLDITTRKKRKAKYIIGTGSLRAMVCLLDFVIFFDKFYYSLALNFARFPLAGKF
jgi:hypothetical protein